LDVSIHEVSLSFQPYQASPRRRKGGGGLDEHSEGIPVMFLRRPSLRHFRTLWVEPREDGEGTLEQNQRLMLEGLDR